MKRIVGFQTSDGILHADQAAATKHAKRRYDDAMSTMRHRIVESDSFGRITHSEASKMLEWVEKNFSAVAEAARLREDAETVSNQVDDGEE
jgi:hypothetical protein